MKIVELFAGTKSISKAFERAGHQCFTIDNNADLNPDLCIDINDFTPEMLPEDFKHPDVVWASPPCTCFSVASIGVYWNDGQPIKEEARQAIQIVQNTIDTIQELKPKYWFIENPVGMLRTLPIMRPYLRKTATYCQYGDTRQKPTDIWTNCENWRPKKCQAGDFCHEAAPRGSKTGTQGLDNAKDRGVIPDDLCDEIVRICTTGHKTSTQVTLCQR